MAEEIKLIGVVGSGQMGEGIALLASANGFDVLLLDSDPAALTRARKYISNFSNSLVSNGQYSREQANDAIARLNYTSKLNDFHSADIIIEAIIESESAKKELFSKLDRIAKKTAILASNTSSISISRLATTTSRSQQVIGMHFMYPPPVMKLVEIIRGADTSDDAFRLTKALAERLGKTVVCSKDYPGFIVNRILAPMINEAFYTLYTGVAIKEDIDTGMKLGTNHPMCPFQLGDFLGLDVVLSVLRVLHQGLGDSRYAPCPLLVQLVDAGHFGKKSGIGVYDYRKEGVEMKASARL